jgi:hypothetical protein
MKIVCKYKDETTGEPLECILGYCKEYYTCEMIGRIRGQSLNDINEARKHEAEYRGAK